MTDSTIPRQSAAPAGHALPQARSGVLPWAGIGFGLGGYFLWGISPIYFKAAGGAGIPLLELNAHRVLWSCLLCLTILLAIGKRKDWLAVLRTPRLRKALAGSAVFMLINWLVFVWAIDRNQVIACSLGYYINPLFAVLLGRLVLKERMSRVQWGAFGLAAAGVAVLVGNADSAIWLSLIIAVTWGFYGLIRKRNPVDSLIGLTVETMVLLPFALAYLGWLVWTGEGALGTADSWTHLLLLLAGPVTTAPLVLFAAGWRRLRVATMSLLQYLSPTLQFLLAVLLWNETFTGAHAVAFACIWGALIVYSWNSWQTARKAM
ncbi:MAG: EamA family transporter RarD [Alphaproteobacteria bacterium]|nr:EamA family transporter RarD [Alphaproteobacteria bacterium]